MPKNKKTFINSSNQVHRILDMHPTIKIDLSNGIINVRKLAKFIITHYLPDASLDAVIGSIRRYNTYPSLTIFENARKIISLEIIISTRHPIVSISLEKNQIIQDLIPKLFYIIPYQQGDILRILQAEKSIKLLIDQNNLKKLYTIISKKFIKDITKKLAEIHINMNPQVINTPGITSLISSAFAINNINIREYIGCGIESMWYINEEDLIRAYQAIYDTTQPCI